MKMMNKIVTEVDVALEIIDEIAAELNISIPEIRNVLIKLSERGISGAEGGKHLRKILKELKNE